MKKKLSLVNTYLIIILLHNLNINISWSTN